jgi:hypothetical protein
MHGDYICYRLFQILNQPTIAGAPPVATDTILSACAVQYAEPHSQLAASILSDSVRFSLFSNK